MRVGVFALVVGDVVRLVESSGGEGCLAGEAFEAVAVGGAMVGTAVGAWIAVGSYGGLRGRCSGSDFVLVWRW